MHAAKTFPRICAAAHCPCKGANVLRHAAGHTLFLHLRMLRREQAALGFNAADIPGQASVCAHHAVAGEDNRNFIVSNRTAIRAA